jgi:hypothetical protein
MTAYPCWHSTVALSIPYPWRHSTVALTIPYFYSYNTDTSHTLSLQTQYCGTKYTMSPRHSSAIPKPTSTLLLQLENRHKSHAHLTLSWYINFGVIRCPRLIRLTSLGSFREKQIINLSTPFIECIEVKLRTSSSIHILVESLHFLLCSTMFCTSWKVLLSWE